MGLALGRVRLIKFHLKGTQVSYRFSERTEVELDKWYNAPRMHEENLQSAETIGNSCPDCIGLFRCSDQGNCKDYIECLRQYMKSELRDEVLKL